MSALDDTVILEEDKKGHSAEGLLFASFVHNSRCPCSSLRIVLTLAPNFLFVTSLAMEVKTW